MSRRKHSDDTEPPAMRYLLVGKGPKGKPVRWVYPTEAAAQRDLATFAKRKDFKLEIKEEVVAS